MKGDGVPLFEILFAADRVANAAMWLVVHEMYAQNVCLDGRDLAPEELLALEEPKALDGKAYAEGMIL